MKHTQQSKVRINGHYVYVSQPDKVPPRQQFVGRETELRLCRAAWGLDDDGKAMPVGNSYRLHFRLEGPAGVGKNELVYELARQANTTPFYMMQGHEEFTPEDLALVLVPDTERPGNAAPLVLRMSPLASAIYNGGIFFLDEINRIPERALAALASVLDDRQSIYSAMAGFFIGPKDAEAARRFRFCCALNPQTELSGRGALPDYIDERTLPAIKIGYLTSRELREVVSRILNDADPNVLGEFDRWYKRHSDDEISTRQAIALVQYASNYRALHKVALRESLDRAAEMIFGSGDDED